MLTLAPLPRWVDLGRLLWRKKGRSPGAAPGVTSGTGAAGWLSQSSWSLALICQWRTGRNPLQRPIIWIPDYFCNSALAPLRRVAGKLVFYPITNELEPDLSVCRGLAGENPPDIFILVHYFGRPVKSAGVCEFCVKHRAWLVEDGAHVFYPTAGVGEKGDFVLFSPHKLLALPDGALLCIRTDGPGKISPAELTAFGPAFTWPTQLSGLAQELGAASKAQIIRPILWLLKRVLQKLGVRGPQQSRFQFADAAGASASPAVRPYRPGISKLSVALLAISGSNTAMARRARRRNELLWDEVMAHQVGGAHSIASCFERNAGGEWTPYLAAYQIEGDSPASVFRDCIRRGLPVTTWPDLPPEVSSQPDRHRVAWGLRHRRIFLPVHQTLNLEQEIVRQTATTRKNRPANALETTESGIPPADWGRSIANASRPNLLQNWDYGNAKERVEKWRTRRITFTRNDEPIACVQILERRIAGLFKVSRINRGPVAIQAISEDERSEIWRTIGDLGNIYVGRILTIAPEIEFSGPALYLLATLGFRGRAIDGYRSAWLDLRAPLESLRSRLDGKWRNMLANAEKSALTIRIECDHDTFYWMLDRYQELMAENEFSGPSVTLLRELEQHSQPRIEFLVMKAVLGEETVAAVCLICHDSSATYLLGWNSLTGRKLRANHFLLWQSALHLRSSGISRFDLGGIDPENTPGIAAFKRGINGQSYELIGEYLKW